MNSFSNTRSQIRSLGGKGLTSITTMQWINSLRHFFFKFQSQKSFRDSLQCNKDADNRLFYYPQLIYNCLKHKDLAGHWSSVSVLVKYCVIINIVSKTSLSCASRIPFNKGLLTLSHTKWGKICPTQQHYIIDILEIVVNRVKEVLGTSFYLVVEHNF